METNPSEPIFFHSRGRTAPLGTHFWRPQSCQLLNTNFRHGLGDPSRGLRLPAWRSDSLKEALASFQTSPIQSWFPSRILDANSGLV